MKKTILSLFVILMATFSFAQGGLEGVIVEQVDASVAGPGQISYRVFIDLEPGRELQQVYGNSTNPLNISTTTAWYNDVAGSTNGELINSLFLSPPFDLSFPGLPFDSYIALGAASTAEWGVLASDDPSGRLALGPVNAVSLLGTINVAGAFGFPSTDNSLVADTDGQFFTLTSNADVAPGNRIYIGQFTTDGVFSFALNIQTRVAGTADFTVLNAADTPALNYPSDTCTPVDCDDGDPCTIEACIDEVCVNTPINCDDGDACTLDGCSLGVCFNEPLDCDDGDACTVDSCDPVTGCVNSAIDCDDSEACTTDSCDPATGCVNTAIDCDDDDPTTNDSCEDGSCINTPIGCDDQDACTTDEVDPATGGCVYSDVDCDDGNECTTDSCDPATGCVYTDVDCDDGDACTTDSCEPSDGCINTSIDCDDSDACTTDSCDPTTGCIYTDVDCDDGDACTTDSCEPAAGCIYSDVDCDDGDPTTTDSCDPTTGCVNTPIGGPANDLCDDAIAIECGDVIDGTTTGSTPVADDCFSFNTSGGVWYSLIGTGDDITVTTCAFANFDTQIGLFTGTCDDLVCQGGNNDWCGLQSTIGITSTLGDEYYIYVTGFAATTGDFTLSITCDGDVECPNLGLNIGDACDDGDPNTFNDTVTPNCTCEGEVGCPTPVNDTADGALPNSPDRVWGVPGWDTYDVSCATLSAQACDGSSPTSDSWYSFVAQAENQGILARANPDDPNADNVDMAVEIFDATLTPLAGLTGGDCAVSRSCFNNAGPGVIERCVPGDLTVGDTYFYRVYDAADSDLTLVDTKVKTFAPHPILDGCQPFVFDPTHSWSLENPTNIYNSPPVPVFFVRMVMTDASGSIIAMTPPKNPIAIGGMEFAFNEFAPAVGPGNYNVHAQNEVKMMANGCISGYWSQLGPGCPVEIGAPAASSLSASNVTNDIAFSAYPNPNNGDQVFLELVDFDDLDAHVIVTIVDMYGKQVHMEQFANSVNDTQKVITFNQNLRAGMYFINLTVNERVITQKLVVQ